MFRLVFVPLMATVLLGCVPALILLFSLNGFPLTPRFWIPNSKFNSANLRKVELGLTRANVIELLGKPIEMEESEGFFVYSKAHFFPPACPKAWIHFDLGGTVKDVYVKNKIWCFDDSSPYGLSSGSAWDRREELDYFFK